MTTNITDELPVVPGNPSIPLTTATTRVKAWLDVVKKIPPFGEDPTNIPRALYISDKDFSSMMEECKDKYKDYTIKGVRIYFGLKPADDNPEGPADTLCGMMVPVLHKNASTHVDAIYTTLNDPNPNDTSIYDFTSPCPKYCDQQSELYVLVS